MDGMTGSKILMGKKLLKMGIIVSKKLINGRCLNVYVGITDKKERDDMVDVIDN